MVAFARDSRSTIRRAIGALTGRMVYGTASAGGATSFTIDFVKQFPDDAEQLVGGTAYIVSGTGAGQGRVVTDTVQSTGVATVSPAWTTNPDSTSVIEVWQESYDPYRVNDLINLAIRRVYEKVWVPARVNPSSIDSTYYKTLTLPATLIAVSGFSYKNSSNDWTTYKVAQDPAYLDEHPYSIAMIPGGLAIIKPVLSASIPTSNMYVHGYTRPSTLSSDSDLSDVRSDYLTFMVAFYLEAGEAEGPSLDPRDHGGRAGNWLREALKIYQDIVGTPLDPDTQEVLP